MKISKWVDAVQTKLSGADERQRAMLTLNLDPSTLIAANELRWLGKRAFALNALGLTNDDLKTLAELRTKQDRPRVEQILDLMGEPSNFRKFLVFCYAKYKGYKAKHQNKWKLLKEEDLINKIKSNPLTGEDDLFQLVLNSFFLFWKRRYSKEASLAAATGAQKGEFINR